MHKFRKLIAPLALSVSLALSAVANSAPMEHREPAFRHLLAQLNLSQAQRQDIRQLFKSARADKALFREDKRQFMQQLHALIQSPDWDETAANSLLMAQQEIRSQVALQRASSKHQLWQLLNAQQQSKLVALLEQQTAKKPPQEEGLKLLGKLNLDTEQQTQIEQVRQMMQAERERLSAKTKAFLAAERSLINTQEFNQSQWQSLYSALQMDTLAISLSKAESRNKVWNILNDSQQQQLLELLKAHKKDSNKHHRKQRATTLEI